MTENEVYQKYIKPHYTKLGYFTFKVDHERLPDVYISRAVNNREIIVWL